MLPKFHKEECEHMFGTVYKPSGRILNDLAAWVDQ